MRNLRFGKSFLVNESILTSRKTTLEASRTFPVLDILSDFYWF